MTLYKATSDGNVPLTPNEEMEISAEWTVNESAQQELIIKDKTADLWKAADAYIYASINGAGLSILASGTQLGKPKCKSVAAWCDSIWAEYYVRKAQINVIDAVNLDFSILGSMPYTILELREEVAYLWQ